MVLNSIEGFASGGEGEVYEGGEVGKNVVSTEGCFACNLNGPKGDSSLEPPPQQSVSISVPDSKVTRVSPDENRRRRHHRPPRRRRHLDKPGLIGVTAILKTRQSLFNISLPQSLAAPDPAPPTRQVVLKHSWVLGLEVMDLFFFLL